MALSFYGTAPSGDAADGCLADYDRFLAQRNGTLSGDGFYEHRETMLDDFDGLAGHFRGDIDAAKVQRSYAGQRVDLSAAELALTTFVKINAAEAYGVEVIMPARQKYYERPELIFQLQRLLGFEERYHTRMLLGVTTHFDGLTLDEAWRPTLVWTGLMKAMAKAPPTLFHPIVLGSEIGGVFAFNWLLERVATLFPDDPDIRDSMERRLVEVLIDEVGHVAFNRVAVGDLGIRVAKPLAAQVLRTQDRLTPELKALGLDRAARSRLGGFDFGSLPEEVRRRAFFV